MESKDILMIITFFVSLILGFIAKKSKYVSTNLIPIQNLCIGVIFAFVEWCITKNCNNAIIISGILAGGTYDIFHNLNKLFNNKEA